jgi:hypothetical protein
MKSTDQIKLEEAYISALRKQAATPEDELQSSITPEISDLPVTPSAVVVKNVTPEVTPAMPSDSHAPGNLEDEAEEDSMTSANLYSIFTDAKKLHEYIQGGYHLEAWMQQKIAICCDNINAVSRAAEYDVAKNDSGCGVNPL